MIKKTLLLAVAALAAMAVIGPATSSAAYNVNEEAEKHWFMGGSAFEGEATVHLRGTASFTNGIIGGISCTVDATIDGNSSSSGTVHFHVTTNTCEGTVTFAGCEVTEITNTNGPESFEWSYELVELEDGRVGVLTKNADINSTLGNCGNMQELELEIPETFAQADEPASITKATLSDEGATASVDGSFPLGVTVSGTLNVDNEVTEEEEGTWQIG